MSEQSPSDDDQVAEAVASAVARAHAAGGARFQLRLGELVLPTIAAELRGATAVLRYPMRTFAGWVVKAGSAPRNYEGVIDVRHRRYMVFGEYAEMFVDGEHRGGAPGRTLSSLRAVKDPWAVPLWLCDLPALVTSAREVAREDVRGRPCRVVSFDIDHRSPALPSPWAEDPGSLKPRVWIDSDTNLCRVEAYAEYRTEAIELWDFGGWVDELDWTRLPAATAADS